MKNNYSRIAVLICGLFLSGLNGMGAADPLEEEGALHSYLRQLQVQSRIYSSRMSAAVPAEEERLLQEFRQKMSSLARPLSQQRAQQAALNGREAEWNSGRIRDLRAKRLEECREEYLHSFEQMTELYISRYLEPSGDSRRGLHADGGEVYELLQQVNSELQLAGHTPGREERLAGLSHWKQGEYRLLDQRAAWERKMESDYYDELHAIKQEYVQVEEGYSERLTELDSQYQQGLEYWRQQARQQSAGWKQEFEALRTELQQKSQEAGGLYCRLASAYQHSQAMLSEAELKLYLDEETAYWSDVREREQARIEELQTAWSSLVKPGRDLPRLLLNAEPQLLKEEIVTIEQLLQQPASPGLEDFLQTKLRSDRDELAALRKELERTEAKNSELLEEAGCSDAALQNRVLLHRSAELQQILEQLEQSEDYLAERCSADRRVENELYADLRASLLRLVPVLEGESTATPDIEKLEQCSWEALPEAPVTEDYRGTPEQLQQDAALWASELQRLYDADSGDEFLKQCALGLYHADSEALDPGYCTGNQSYRKLTEKLGSSTAAYLGGKAEQAHAALLKDPRRRRMFRFYSVLIELQPDPAVSCLSRAAAEDLGQLLFAGVTGHARRRAADLSDERDELLTKAAVYSGLAAACYATLNFPGGAAMTALAATYASKASDVKSKRDDLNALRQSLTAQGMSGQDEREQVQDELAVLNASCKKIAEAGERVHCLKEELHSDAYWRKKLTAGRSEFNFIRFFSDDAAGAEPLCVFLREQEGDDSSGSSGKGTLADYIQKMKTRARNESELLQTERTQCLGSTVSRLAAALPLSPGRAALSAAAECDLYLEGLGGQEQLAYYLSGSSGSVEAGSLLSLLQLEGAAQLESARRRGLVLEQRLLKKKQLWQQGAEFEIAEITQQRDADLSQLRSAGLRWDREFRRAYLSRQELWEQRAHKYHQAKRLWLNSVVRSRAEEVSAAGADILQIDPQQLSSRLTMVPLDSSPGWTPPARTKKSAQQRDLADLFSGLDMSGGEGLLPELERTRAHYSEYRSHVDQIYRDAELQSRQTAFEAGVRMFSRALQGYRDELEAKMETANTRAADSLHTTLRSAGYRRRGGVYQRNAIVDVTYFEHERELQSIAAYRDFRLPETDWSARLHRAAESGGDAAAAERQYETLVQAIGAQQKLIFGGYGGEAESYLERIEAELRGRFSGAAARFSAAEGYQQHEDTQGLFYWHVGYAPVMSESDPERVQRAGYGESGRILTGYYRNEARLGRALSMMDLAGWDRRLWDDDGNNDGKADSWMQAATIRSLSDLGIKTAAGLSLGPVAAALAGLTDDAFFAAADVSAGYKNWDEAAFDFGKQALLQTAIAAGGGVWSGLEVQPQWDQTAGLFGNAAPAAGRAAGKRLLSAGSAGLQYSRGDGLRWRSERFRDSLWSTEAAVELGLAAAGAVGDAAVHNGFLQRKHSYGFARDDIRAMRSGARFGGELLASGIEYAATGQTTWNLLGLRGNGLLELKLRDGTAGLALGRDGRKLTSGKLTDLLQAVDLFSLQQQIAAASRRYAADGREADVARMLRFQAGFGDARSRAVLQEILSGTVQLRFPRTAEYRGRTELDSGRRREISIALGMHAGLEDPSLALTLQHEAHRDGLCGEGNVDETAEAVLAHAAMAAGISTDPLYGMEFLYKDASILQDMAAIASGERGVAALMQSYSSEGDFWRINAAGDLLWDGSHHLWGENGMLVQTHGPGSFSQDVADYMGISRDEALQLMRKAGYMWNEQRGTYEKAAAEFGLKVRPELAAEYDLLRRFGRNLNGAADSTAYVWALREQAYRKELAGLSEGMPARSYEAERLLAMDALLADRDGFFRAAGADGTGFGADAAAGTDEAGFGGIEQRATLTRYSQQWLEAAVTGGALDTAAGNGYCLAESIAAHFVEHFGEVDWEDIEQAFGGQEGWGGSFDPDSGWVGDKQSFTAELSRRLGVDAVAREFRFDSLEDMNRFLATTGESAAGSPAAGGDGYSFVADYGSHFTHVRPDGIELNTYNGWRAPESGPQAWRVYAWDY